MHRSYAGITQIRFAGSAELRSALSAWPYQAPPVCERRSRLPDSSFEEVNGAPDPMNGVYWGGFYRVKVASDRVKVKCQDNPNCSGFEAARKMRK